MRHFASLSVNQQKTPRKIGVFFLILHFVICCTNRVQYLANKLFIRKQHTIVLCLILHFLICYGNRLQYLANDLHCRKWHAKLWLLILHLIRYGNRLQYLANDLHCRKWHAKFWLTFACQTLKKYCRWRNLSAANYSFFTKRKSMRPFSSTLITLTTTVSSMLTTSVTFSTRSFASLEM